LIKCSGFVGWFGEGSGSGNFGLIEPPYIPELPWGLDNMEKRRRRDIQAGSEGSENYVNGNRANYVALINIGGEKISLNLQSIVTFAFLQLPAVSLALYGIFCALRHPTKKIGDKIADSLLALTLMILPYFVIEIFTLLLQIDFTGNGLDFLIKRVKSLCGPVIDKMAETFDLLKFLPNKDPDGKDRALSMGVVKLITGSCPQLVFQAVLLGGYTPWSTDFSGKEEFPWSQAASILSSALMIAKTTAEIVIYQRKASKPDSSVKYNTVNEWLRILVHPRLTGNEYTVVEEVEMAFTVKMALKAEEALKVAWKALLSILPLTPLVLSSLIFNTGTLVLTIIVTKWYSAIYIGIVLLLNLTISFIFPYSFARKTEEKLGLTFKFSRKDEAEKLKKRRVIRGIFTSWANLFVFLRPVENMTYHKIVHVSLLQPLRFLVNIVTLIIVCHITWTTHYHYTNQEISLIVTFCIVFAAGILNMVELRYFYTKNDTSQTKNDPDEMEVTEEGNLESNQEIKTSLLQAVPPSQSASLSPLLSVESASGGQFTLTTTRQSKQSVTSMTSRKSTSTVSQFTTVQEGVQLEGALADEKGPLLAITEKAEGEPDTRMLTNLGEEGQRNSDALDILADAPEGQTSVSETEVVGPNGTVYTKKVSVRSMQKVSINGKDVNLDNLDDPNSDLTDEERRQIRLAFQGAVI